MEREVVGKEERGPFQPFGPEGIVEIGANVGAAEEVVARGGSTSIGTGDSSLLVPYPLIEVEVEVEAIDTLTEGGEVNDILFEVVETIELLGPRGVFLPPVAPAALLGNSILIGTLADILTGTGTTTSFLLVGRTGAGGFGI